MRANSNIMFWTPKTPAEPLRIGGAPVAVVRSARARTMRLSLDRKTGGVRLTLPKRAALAGAIAWAETKQGWIAAQLASVASTPVVPGMALDVAGQSLTLDWNPAWPRAPRIVGETLQVGGPQEQLSARLIRWLKAEARSLLTRESHDYAALCGVTVTQVGIGDPVSRWGSCSASGAIRYSWRLILAPAHVRRATVAHEVAHRVHMNHGREFHALVAEIYEGEASAARRWLRTHGQTLHGFGRQA
jgi:predicted metal-dependent hydrolase